jgi:uncharacterized paraquat-inducible protein A
MSTVSYPNMTICAGCDQTFARRSLVVDRVGALSALWQALEHGHHFSISTWLALTLTAAILMVFRQRLSGRGHQPGRTAERSDRVAVRRRFGRRPWGTGRDCGGDDRHWRPGFAGAYVTLDIEFRGGRASCPYFVAALRVLRASKPWGMIEVCLLAILVALVKLSGFLHVVAGIGVAAIVVLAPLMAVITNRNAGDLWPLYEARNGLRFQAARVGRPDHLMACDLCGLVHEGAAAKDGAAIACARCGSEVRARKPDSIVRTWAFLLAALVLYVPANVLPGHVYTPFGQ